MYPFIINGENVPELGKEVFQCMDFETLMKCRQVSTEWCGHIDSFLWDRLSKIENRLDQPFLPDFPAYRIPNRISDPRILVLLMCTGNKEKRIQIARLYLRHAKDKNPKGIRGDNPLFYSAWQGETELFELFFEEAEDKNPRGVNDWTPLHGAALNGHLDICKMIVDNIENKRPLTGAMCNYRNGATPLQLAGEISSPNHQAIIDLLEPFEP